MLDGFAAALVVMFWFCVGIAVSIGIVIGYWIWG